MVIPDYHFLPVGNAGNISAYWMGYKEFHKLGKINGLPKMMGFQAAGFCPDSFRTRGGKSKDYCYSHKDR